jgi:hypothetical protein
MLYQGAFADQASGEGSMMKTLARYAVPVAAVIGLAMVFAPSAEARTIGPSTHTIAIRTSFSTVNPCNGQTVNTRGLGIASITVNGSQVHVGAIDGESGGPYDFSEVAEGFFNGLSSSYTIPAVVVEFDQSVPADSFYESVSVNVSTRGGDVPTGFHSAVLGATCGLEFNF